MDARYRSLLVMLVVLLDWFLSGDVDTGAGHEVTVQVLVLLFGLGAAVGAMLGLGSLRSRSGGQ